MERIYFVADYETGEKEIRIFSKATGKLRFINSDETGIGNPTDCFRGILRCTHND